MLRPHGYLPNSAPTISYPSFQNILRIGLLAPKFCSALIHSPHSSRVFFFKKQKKENNLATYPAERSACAPVSSGTTLNSPHGLLPAHLSGPLAITFPGSARCLLAVGESLTPSPQPLLPAGLAGCSAGSAPFPGLTPIDPSGLSLTNFKEIRFKQKTICQVG